MSNLTILGTGGFGIALAAMCHRYGHTVTLWGKFPEEIAEIRQCGEHRRLLPGVPVDSAIELTADISAAAKADLVILAVPSFAVRETARTVSPVLPASAVVANVGKGLEKGSKKRLSQVISEEIPGNPIVALSGPSHAEEIARGVPTTIVSASQRRQSAEWVQELRTNPTLRIYVSDDVSGVELSGALKNIIAVCAGICDGLQLGDNTKAALITRGLAEIARLGTALGADAATFSGLAGVGDLIVTCTSMHSRNLHAGMLIGRGKDVETAKKEVGQVVEGINALPAACKLAKKYKVEMPIVNAVDDILSGRLAARDALATMMGRQLKQE